MCNELCYLGDTLDGEGGADLAATARIRNGWMKFRELFPFLTSRFWCLVFWCLVVKLCTFGVFALGVSLS